MRTRRRDQNPHVGDHPESIYLARLSNGIVKIGSSSNTATRIAVLIGDVKKRFGATVEEVLYLPCSGGFLTEMHCIREMRKQAQPVIGTREYFQGISVDEARKIVEGVVARYQSDATGEISWDGTDLLTPVIAALKRLTPSQIAVVAVACDATSVTIKNIRNGTSSKQGPGYYLVEALHRYLKAKKWQE